MIYQTPYPNEKLNVYFGEIFRDMRRAIPSSYGAFFTLGEEAFHRAGYREKNSSGVENILIVRLDLIGDMIMTSGFLREVRKNFPNAKITLVVRPQVRALVELCPYVNEILTLDKDTLEGDFVEGLEKIAVFCRDNLWQKNFSIAFSPRWYNDTLSELVLVWLSGAKERIGYGTYPFHSWQGEPPPEVSAQDNFFLTKNIVTPKNVVSDADRNFYLLTAAGYKVSETHMELFYGERDFQRAKEFLENLPPNCKKISLGIGANELNRRYPVDKLLIALNELAKKNLAFVIIGGKTEIDEAEYLAKNLPHERVVNLAGKTTLRETEATIAQTDFYIGNDTGVLHMAATAKVPVIGIYREAVDRENILPPILSGLSRFPPYQTRSVILRPAHPLEDCATLPPRYGHCHHIEPHCITQITPQEIVEAFEYLEKNV